MTLKFIDELIRLSLTAVSVSFLFLYVSKSILQGLLRHTGHKDSVPHWGYGRGTLRQDKGHVQRFKALQPSFA
jgi:hypothetical protein